LTAILCQGTRAIVVECLLNAYEPFRKVVRFIIMCSGFSVLSLRALVKGSIVFGVVHYWRGYTELEN